MKRLPEVVQLSVAVTKAVKSGTAAEHKLVAETVELGAQTEIVGLVLSGTTVTVILLVSGHPLALVTVTVNVAAVETVIAAVVALLDHK